MARIAVLHNTLDFRGGADAVCVHTCAALAESHDVTLFTVSQSNPAAVAAQFDVDLDVQVAAPPGATAIATGFSILAPAMGPQLAARSVLLSAFFRRHADAFDLAVSTANELSLPLPSVQYVHFPQFNLERTDAGDSGRLDGLWSHLAAPTGPELERNVCLLANSSWTADVVADIYGHRPAVCHPPVDPIEGKPWEEREPGIVVLGRIAPDKRTLDAIHVVDGLQEAGYDVSCTIVGSAPSAYRNYVSRVRTAVSERPYVSLETDVSRQRIRNLLGRNRYGLNAKPDEHFGMAVAEYVAAGMFALAPDEGGQVDVLDGDETHLFSDIDEATALLGAAIDADRRPTRPRNRFGRERFADEIRAHVAAVLTRG
ncbi:MAG: glycosyltransferase [Halolamina sp.]|uniref:glycosyltransferase n=1 Tax=Halolamina sp. TaxID=1940283 RepID=UPI002FC37227